MPPINAPVAPRQKRIRSLRTIAWVTAAVAVVIFIVGYIFVPSFFSSTSGSAQASSYIISLATTIKDAQGIPYAGTVLYDPTVGTYSYIATEDEGVVTPLGPSSFSSGTQYIAMRAGASSTDLVIYDRTTLAPVRVVKHLDSNDLITTAVWSPNDSEFAYINGSAAGLPSLEVESATESSTKSLGFFVPLGFSPDGTKILTRAAPSLTMVNVADGTSTTTIGATFPDPQPNFVLSPSGKLLFTATSTTADLYTVDWNTSTLTHAGTIPLDSGINDAVFESNDTLLVREKGSDTISTYAYEAGKGITKINSGTLSLPEGAHILNVVTP